jgi:hypothetical protein
MCSFVNGTRRLGSVLSLGLGSVLSLAAHEFLLWLRDSATRCDKLGCPQDAFQFPSIDPDNFPLSPATGERGKKRAAT